MSNRTLRPAEWGDADLLLQWRNDPLTRHNSLNQDEVARADHEAWLQRALAAAERRLWIALDGETPVGVVRQDFSEQGCELSWTVAPDQRGRGYGAWMVKEMAEQVAGRVWARIRPGNLASEKIARGAGLTLQRTADDVEYWERAECPRD